MQTLLEGSMVTRLKSGSCHIPFAVQKYVDPVVAGWKAFLAKPKEYKDQFTFDDGSDPKQGADHGYITRGGDTRPDGVVNDIKQFFHFKTGLINMIARRSVDQMHGQLNFLFALRNLYDYCFDEMKKQMNALDSEMPGYDFYERLCSEEVARTHTLRLLSYCAPKEIGQVVGKSHVDRNLATIHVDESHGGLMLETPAGEVLYKKKPAHALLFMGAKAGLMTGGELVSDYTVVGGRLPGVPHRVITQPSCLGQERWAVVFFGHTPVNLVYSASMKT